MIGKKYKSLSWNEPARLSDVHQTKPDDDRRFRNPACTDSSRQLPSLQEIVPEIFNFSSCNSKIYFFQRFTITKYEHILSICDPYFSEISPGTASESPLTLHVVVSGGRIVQQRRAFLARSLSCQNVLHK